AMPAYNEGPVIGNVVSNLKANGYYDILVVDDCSKDDTSAQAKKADATVIRHVINRGAGAATATAISYARKNDYDFLVLMDADGQHSPADVEPLLLCAQSHDVVIGSRNIDDESMPLVRRIANRVGSIVTWFFFGKYVRDSQSGFKVFNKRALKTITITFDRFEFCSEIIGEINRNNLSVSEVPITVIYTEHSQSKGQSIVNGFKMIARFVLRS
ncbi:MAG TPA: glycosyltransferase family 2 protein, partial [Acidobacteriota bacterium]|nr:glycosyltransferase family 2 protein [Acidobacteriota bacterium]